MGASEWWRELGLNWSQLPIVLVAATGIYVTVIAYSRLSGLRSFSRMSIFDYATTVAVGAVLGRVILVRTTLLAGVVGLGALFLLQRSVAALRRHTRFGRLVDNRPILLMAGPEMIAEHLELAHVTEDDVREKLRLAGVHRFEEVNAVVMERSGDISVVAGGDGVDPGLFGDVLGRCRLEE